MITLKEFHKFNYMYQECGLNNFDCDKCNHTCKGLYGTILELHNKIKHICEVNPNVGKNDNKETD